VEASPSEEYKRQVSALESAVSRCTHTSQACAGRRSPTSAHFYASLLFTSLCTRGITLLSLVPHSPIAKKRFENWDFASAAGITRSILEIRLTFFYLCIESVEAEEWNCRWNTLNMHDCTSRIHLFQSLPDSEETLAAFGDQQNELRKRLAGNQYFLSLDAGLKKRILHGQVAHLLPLEEIGRRAGIELNDFRLTYKLFSSQVHGFPLSFYRMADDNRGRGVHSESEEGYTILSMSLAAELLEAAEREMSDLFKEKSP
jgi:hypothetical protein